MFEVIYFIDLFALGISLSEEFIFRESAFLTEKEEGTKIGDSPLKIAPFLLIVKN